MHRQSGGGITQWFLLIAVLVLVGTVAFRLIPIYAENWTVVSIVEDLVERPGARDKNIRQLRSELAKGFQVNSVDSLEPEVISLEEKEGVQTLRLQYETRTHLLGNLDAVVVVDRSYHLAQ
ncbi:protein of unknown function [Ectothiorhodospira mobilis]|uniref:DUF4845 domain-containing protein n=1 Tax=Ectothiorhodospira mobilis TaxID=195064 RepID=A0A1I4RS64_ECTMO|nr:DUF4845 domain-containing protein [Ectothiorhodospira mobilis]SFM55051.1 protein of unknown function [Ectothiorhodospira mobilis]